MDVFKLTQNVEKMWMALIMDNRLNVSSPKNVQEIKTIFTDNFTPFSKYKFETSRVQIETQQQLDQLNDAFVRTIFRFISSKCPHLLTTIVENVNSNSNKNTLLPISPHSQSATRDDFLKNKAQVVESAYTKKMHEYETINTRTIPSQPNFADEKLDTPVDMERAVTEAISRRNYDVPIVQPETQQLVPKPKLTTSSFQLNKPKPEINSTPPKKYLTLGPPLKNNLNLDLVPKQISWGADSIIIETNEFELSIKHRYNSVEFNYDATLLELDKLLKIIIAI